VHYKIAVMVMQDDVVIESRSEIWPAAKSNY